MMMADNLNEAASAMAKARWSKTTPEQRSEELRKVSGGRMESMTKKQRSEVAKKAVAARWAKAKNAKVKK